MAKWISLAASAAALMISGCYFENDDWTGATQAGRALEQTGSPSMTAAHDDSEGAYGWIEIAPGVWERKRPEGGSERLGFGTEGFEFALDQARQERTMLLAQVEIGQRAPLSKRLGENQNLIAYLEASLSESRKSNIHESIPVAPPDDDVHPEGTSSDGVCAGYYGFDISFQLGMADGTVTSRADWTEFGPFAPYTKTLHTYAYAAHEAYGETFVDEDSDSFGPFSGYCCVSVESSATAYPTFAPQLYGSAYLSVTNGCAASRFYSSSYP